MLCEHYVKDALCTEKYFYFRASRENVIGGKILFLKRKILVEISRKYFVPGKVTKLSKFGKEEFWDLFQLFRISKQYKIIA